MTSTARMLTVLVFCLVSVAAKSHAQPVLTLDERVEQFERGGWTMQLKLGEPIIQAGDKRALIRLERWLEDEDRHVRANVAFVFAGLGDDRGFRILGEILTDQSERPIGVGIPGGRWSLKRQIEADRYYAVHVLGHLKSPRAADLLLPLLNDPTVSYKAVWALGQVGDARAVPALIEMLTHEDALIRISAIQALETLRAKEALPHLRALLTDLAKPRAGDQIPVGETARRAIATLERER